MTVDEGKANFGPLIASGVVLGAGLGGFLDGILLHQILQAHNMISAIKPPDTLINAKINMTWDGYFHAGVWILTAFGLTMLFKAGARRDVPWSGQTFVGSLILGFGIFNLVEGIIDHHLLQIHHVHEYAPPATQALYDYGFLGLGGVLMILLGQALIGAGKKAWRSNPQLGAGTPR